MSKHNIYGGGILIVDLSNGKVCRDDIDDELVDKFLGGEGFALALTQRYLRPKVDALSPDNVLVISAGALCGTPTPASGKITGVTKMPMPARYDGTCYVGSSSAGSHLFGVMLKNAGYDALVIKGKAKRPAYLKIIDDDVEILDAEYLWGKTDTYTTDWELRKRHGNDCGTMTIGRAGENLVKWSMAIVDRKGTMGRHGFGAVMGSKNLKGIVVYGTKGLEVANIKRFRRKCDEIRTKVNKSSMTPLMRKVGTNALWFAWEIVLNQGNMPLHDYGYLNRSEAMVKFSKHVDGCAGCAWGCKPIKVIQEGKFKGELARTGHFLNPSVIMNRLELKDFNQCLKLHKEDDDAGLCDYTFMSMADWVTRLYGEGNISRSKYSIEFTRDFNTYLKLQQMIINRESIGNVLADGYFAASKEFGVDILKDTVVRGIAKGVDPIYDARFATLDPLRWTYLTSPRPQHAGAHLITTLPSNIPQFPVSLDMIKENYSHLGIPEEEFQEAFTPVPYYGAGFNVALLAIENEHHRHILNSLGACSAYAIGGLAMADDYAEIYSAASGIEKNTLELRTVGERIFNLYKAINVKEGFMRDDDWVEAWMTPRRTPEGKVPLMDYYRTRVITRDDLNRLLDDYYKKRGWDIKRGIPTIAKLRELGI